MTNSETTDEAFEKPTDRTMRIETLGVMNWLGEIGVDGVEDRLDRIGGYDATVRSEQVKSGYVEPATLDATFVDEQRVGVRVRIPGAPYGTLLVLFSMPSANRAATLLLSTAVEDLSEAPNELAHSALLELGTIMANGFLDAWADTFEQRIDVGTPMLVRDQKRTLVRKALQRGEDSGLYIASKLALPEHDIRAEVYFFPHTGTFLRILSGLDLRWVSR